MGEVISLNKFRELKEIREKIAQEREYNSYIADYCGIEEDWKGFNSKEVDFWTELLKKKFEVIRKKVEIIKKKEDL